MWKEHASLELLPNRSLSAHGFLVAKQLTLHYGPKRMWMFPKSFPLELEKFASFLGGKDPFSDCSRYPLYDEDNPDRMWDLLLSMLHLLQKQVYSSWPHNTIHHQQEWACCTHPLTRTASPMIHISDNAKICTQTQH